MYNKKADSALHSWQNLRLNLFSDSVKRRKEEFELFCYWMTTYFLCLQSDAPGNWLLPRLYELHIHINGLYFTSVWLYSETLLWQTLTDWQQKTGCSTGLMDWDPSWAYIFAFSYLSLFLYAFADEYMWSEVMEKIKYSKISPLVFEERNMDMCAMNCL